MSAEVKQHGRVLHTELTFDMGWMRVWLTLATNGPRGWQISEYGNCSVLQFTPQLQIQVPALIQHRIRYLGCLHSPAAHREAQSLPGSSQSHHVHRVSRTRGASSPALGTSPKYCTYETHACSAPPLFYFFTASLSQLHFQWHAKATPGHPLSPYSASSPSLDVFHFFVWTFCFLCGGKPDVQQLTNPGEHEQPEAKRLFEAVLTTPLFLLFCGAGADMRRKHSSERVANVLLPHSSWTPELATSRCPCENCTVL